MSAASPILNIASPRAATGIDETVRALILKMLKGVSSAALRDSFFRGRYANFDDYAAAVSELWGDGPAHEMRAAMAQAANYQPIVVSVPTARQKEEMISEAMLLHMPEPDFRAAVSEVSSVVSYADRTAERISGICKAHGIPWEFTASGGFRWAGGERIEDLDIRPALSAIQDPRFAGVRREFDSARSELALGTASSLKRVVRQSGRAVESAMKVLLAQRGAPFSEQATAFDVFDNLEKAGIVPKFMRSCVLTGACPRDRKGERAAGEAPDQVPYELAEEALTSAGVAIAYLHQLLP